MMRRVRNDEQDVILGEHEKICEKQKDISGIKVKLLEIENDNGLKIKSSGYRR